MCGGEESTERVLPQSSQNVRFHVRMVGLHSTHGLTVPWLVDGWHREASRRTWRRSAFEPRLGACSNTRGDISLASLSVLQPLGCYEFRVHKMVSCYFEFGTGQGILRKKVTGIS